MNLKRLAFSLIKDKIQPNKVVLLYGPRRVGKTTLLKQFVESLPNKNDCLLVNGETKIIQDELSVSAVSALRNFVGNHKIIIIDEAQKVPQIGNQLKLLVDSLLGVSVIASGSASFALAQEVGEPLTGRKKTINLFPLSAEEIIGDAGLPGYKEIRDSLLIFGGYPEIFQLAGATAKQEYLRELADAYLFRDILEMENLKSPRKLRDLLTLLAFQIGREVSLTELAQSLELNRKTVECYLDLLEKSFVIINIRGFSRNLRKEVSKTSRYYFYDNGIRNAIINNFNVLSLRDDVGMLWENYLVMERLKRQSYHGEQANNYFWRTYDQKEIDWVEERGGKLFGYEITWSDKKPKAPPDWLRTYPGASYTLINQDNFLEFIADIHKK